jgi:hypothetical protein
MPQIPALFLPLGITKKSSPVTPAKQMERKRKEQKLCSLLKRSINGNKKTGRKPR